MAMTFTREEWGQLDMAQRMETCQHPALLGQQSVTSCLPETRASASQTRRGLWAGARRDPVEAGASALLRSQPVSAWPVENVLPVSSVWVCSHSRVHCGHRLWAALSCFQVLMSSSLPLSLTTPWAGNVSGLLFKLQVSLCSVFSPPSPVCK
ncbi:hypothetical protein GHT09_017226 [Marmota monax]|uniref:KRAB domain-containing protein n=1 Tax=Marmota monax TaxID=9995 RepID=A0A834Q702_MARMO|nr:hypothetical protein GHT09_017226 [Marmota monax]